MMGQAKNRGSRAQRIAEALGLKQRPLADIKKELGLTDDAEFLGYAVHRPGADEFLAQFYNTNLRTQKAWAKTPQVAIRYEDFSEAYDVSRKCEGSIVVGMFDIGDQIFVTELVTKNGESDS